MLYLKITERLLVIAAAILAVFPLWQYWSEADDRALQRNATLVLAFSGCETSGANNYLRILEQYTPVKRSFVDFSVRVGDFMASDDGREFYLNHFDDLAESADLLDWYATDALILRCADIMRANTIAKDM